MVKISDPKWDCVQIYVFTLPSVLCRFYVSTSQNPQWWTSHSKSATSSKAQQEMQWSSFIGEFWDSGIFLERGGLSHDSWSSLDQRIEPNDQHQGRIQEQRTLDKAVVRYLASKPILCVEIGIRNIFEMNLWYINYIIILFYRNMKSEDERNVSKNFTRWMCVGSLPSY